MELPDLAAELRKFAEDRDWEQFHTPKNLAMAVAAEAGELLEIFQWLTPTESVELDEPQHTHLGEELADILIYVVRLADVAGVDLSAALRSKMKNNARRYPAEIVRGSATKYSDRTGEDDTT